MANEEIRSAAKNAKIPLWKIAQEVGISEPTMTRWLRIPLSCEKSEKILSAISKLTSEVG